MKIILPLLTGVLCLFISTVQGQDTTHRTTQPSPAKKVTESRTVDNPPVSNKIAVSDPGMPPEKPTSTRNKNVSNKATKKKRGAMMALTRSSS